jgi:hypothetical protein
VETTVVPSTGLTTSNEAPDADRTDASHLRDTSTEPARDTRSIAVSTQLSENSRQLQVSRNGSGKFPETEPPPQKAARPS